ncbi:MAG: hypothetical protein U1D30_00380 [Planctomycetota bacterium]
MKRAIEAWQRFWFTPIDPIGLDGVRVLAGTLIFFWLAGFVGHQYGLFSLDGWFDRVAYREASSLPEDVRPIMSWSLLFLAPNAFLVNAIYFGSLVAVALFTLGIATRLTSILTWLVVASFTANPAIFSGGDVLLLILSLYLMVGYLFDGLGTYFTGGDERLSTGELFLGARGHRLFGNRGPARESVAANISLRLIQVHLAIVLFSSATHKLQSSLWWSGTAIWFPLHSPFSTSIDDVLASSPNANLIMIVISLMTYGVLAWELSFPFLMWRPAWRPIMLLGAALGWIGNVFVFGLPIFGPAIFIGCLAFLPAETWRAWIARLAAAIGRSPAAQPANNELVETRLRAADAHSKVLA